VVIAALRPQTAKDNNCYNRDGSDHDCSQYLIRLVAIAISVSENPADGFHVYRTTENNYRDWPNAVVDQDYLVIAHKGGGAETNGQSIATVFSFRQMKDGVAGSSVKGFRIRQVNDQTPVAVVPVANVLTDVYSQAFFFIENLGSGKIKIWYIKKPSDTSAIFPETHPHGLRRREKYQLMELALAAAPLRAPLTTATCCTWCPISNSMTQRALNGLGMA